MEEQTLKINVSQEPEKPEYEEWKIINAAETLIRAEEIKQNAKLMTFIKPELEKKLKAQKGIADILYGCEEKKEGNNDK